MVKCQVCGEEAGDVEFCPKCGYKIPIKTEEELDGNNFEEFTYRHNKRCPRCGTNVYVNAVVCPKCGLMLGNSSSTKKNQTVAILLSFIIPGLGQMYYGFPKTGLTFFLLTCIGLPLGLLIITLLFFILSSYFILGIILVICLIIVETLIVIYNLYDIIKSTDAVENGEYVEDKLFKYIF